MPGKKDKPERAPKKEGQGDKRRLGYLKIKAQELKAEMQAVKNETLELRKKLGTLKKDRGAAGAGDED